MHQCNSLFKNCASGLELKQSALISLGSLSLMNSTAHASAPRPRPSPRPSPHNGANLNTPRYRPATIAELADRARDDQWDPSKGVKHWLKTGESIRRAGKAYVQANDLESAFVEYAKAATLVLEKLPSHREYYTMLNPNQRHNLGLVSLLLICDRHISPTCVDDYEALHLSSINLLFSTSQCYSDGLIILYSRTRSIYKQIADISKWL